MIEQGNQVKEGNIVNIYLDHKFNKNFNGAAKLIKLIEKRHTFILPNERLYTILEDKAIGKDGKHLPLTKEEKDNNESYFRLLNYFSKRNKELPKSTRRFRKEMITNLSEELDSIEILDNLINKYRWDYLGSTESLIDILKDFDNKTIIRFFQQTYMKNWSPSIWRTELWKVEFLPEQYCIKKKWCLYNKPFITTRKIRKLICINPEEDTQRCELRFYSTGTGESGIGSYISNADKKKKREAVAEDDEMTEEEELLLIQQEQMFYNDEDDIDISDLVEEELNYFNINITDSLNPYYEEGEEDDEF